MKFLAGLLLACVMLPAFAQPGPGPGRHAGPEGEYRMPPPERRMSWEERQRLREQVRSGNMTREQAREYWREQRELRGLGPRRSPEERQKLRRDVMDANRALEKR